jgi:hypothetical protein
MNPLLMLASLRCSRYTTAALAALRGVGVAFNGVDVAAFDAFDQAGVAPSHRQSP